MNTQTPEAALAAIFPQPVKCGPYLFNPPTLLHLAALDRLGCAVGASGQLGADAAVKAGFALSLDADALEALMCAPDGEFSAACAAWAAGQPAVNLKPLKDGVTAAINAAFDTAVAGAEADPEKGRPPVSVGP